jgi:hypothetical protein
MIDRTVRPWRLALALLLLDASLSFRNLWPTPAVTWRGDLSIELAVALIGLALAGRWLRARRSRALRVLSGLWMMLVLGRYIDVTAPALWGRDLNFYWDLRFLPDVAAMLAVAAHSWGIALALLALVLALVAIWMAIRWAIGSALDAMADRRTRTIVTGIAIAMVTLFLLPRFDLGVPSVATFSKPVTALYARQARLIARGMSRSHQLPPSPSFAGDLAAVQGADVLLFFIESYGAVAYERPGFSEALAPSRTALAESIRASGFQVASAFVESPTFGGSSWFAHVTLLSGITVGDPDTNALLLSSQRPTLPSAFADRGYRTLGVMPGMWAPWPEGRFYGFSEIDTARALDYEGPPFGWWDLTDQYAFAKLDAMEVDKTNRAPLFVFLPTVSTHTPFTPTPPYQPDWSRMLTPEPYDAADLARVYDEYVDWTNLSPAYLRAMAYSYTTLAGYVKQHAGQDLVIVLVGDHQPPALVSGEGAPWDVPVHVITSRSAVIDALRAHGFVSGMTPARPSLGPMQALTPVLLDAFSSH